MTKEAYFEKLSYALRRRELLPRPVEEDGLLPVEWNGCILCRVTERGAVRYDPTWVDTDKAKAALAQDREAAGTVLEYMTLLEAAPPLKAEGLTDGYRVLAEFNGTVLAGTETLLGAQFVTWARDYDWRGVNNGHYYMEDYQGAKEDFALRSGLVARERVFDREYGNYVNAILMTCGMYDGSGAFAVNVGVPAKSGVGGGIMAVVPTRMGIGIFSPGLDEKGNSLAGIQLLERLSNRLYLSIF